MEKKSVYAHILDEDWIKSFRNREFEIKPADALRAIIEVTHCDETDDSLYEIVEVLGIVPGSSGTQLEIE